MSAPLGSAPRIVAPEPVLQDVLKVFVPDCQSAGRGACGHALASLSPLSGHWLPLPVAVARGTGPHTVQKTTVPVSSDKHVCYWRSRMTGTSTSRISASLTEQRERGLWLLVAFAIAAFYFVLAPQVLKLIWVEWIRLFQQGYINELVLKYADSSFCDALCVFASIFVVKAGLEVM